jgi:thiosulfate dehydrogenase (quinone) large subunit
MPWSLRVLRGFLGVTFVFAGAQKLLDPNFLNANGADYIGTQLQGFAHGTPAAPLMLLLAKTPVLTGIAISLTEIAIGLATLFGAAMLFAAVVGFSISLVLLLSATWHTHPYFLGSDSIYAVAWVALFAGVWETERRRAGARMRTPLQRVEGIDRRELIRGGAIAGLSLLIAGAARALSASPTSGTGLRRASRPATTAPEAQGPTSSPSATHAQRSVQGKVITSLDKLPVGKAIGFTAPGVGPAVLVRLADNSVVAYSRVCTHAGCLVGYDTQSHILYCPCHGAEFDPAHNADPIAGPASRPLQYIKVVVDPTTNDVVLPS